MISRAARTAVLAAALCAGAFQAWAEEVRGRVVGVSDGDTITVLDAAKRQHKVRLAGIDAPEKGQAFGNASKENLSKLVFDRQVTADCYKRDQYGREICRVFRGGTDIPLEQLRAGLAWHYARFANEQRPDERAAYVDAEASAKASRRGLWSDKAPQAPWEWRTQKKPAR